MRIFKTLFVLLSILIANSCFAQQASLIKLKKYSENNINVNTIKKDTLKIFNKYNMSKYILEKNEISDFEINKNDIIVPIGNYYRSNLILYNEDSVKIKIKSIQ